MPKTRRQLKLMEVSLSGTGEGSEEESEDDDDVAVYSFDGKVFKTYQDMVNAKRERNERRLIECGLVRAEQPIQKKSRPTKIVSNEPRRTSNRIAGVKSDGMFVEHEGAGGFVLGNVLEKPPSPTKTGFNHRINDGSNLSVQQAIELTDSKWLKETSPDAAKHFLSMTLAPYCDTKTTKTIHPQSSVIPKSLQSTIDRLSVNDDRCVAKVTPDRIYSIVCHPSMDSLIVSAGDKQGFVGLWNVDHKPDEEGVHLFHVHSSVVCSLEWTSTGDKLLSSSYDGSVRSLDVASQVFTEVFATYDDTTSYSSKLGYGMDQGPSYWIQHVSMDHRFNSNKCFFMSSSIGTSMHVDLRVQAGKLTFVEQLSEKKINTLSLHANGFSLASGGLDGTVCLWDMRKFGSSRNKSGTNHKQRPQVVAEHHIGRSVNSAFFSPSGSHLVATTQADTLDILNDFHVAKDKVKPATRVKHDNRTGQWLTTFQAKWHPSLDMFVVGSMQKPRAIELFDAQGKILRSIYGDVLTAVASRCCFHPSTDNVIVVGGNSSGRVSIAR